MLYRYLTELKLSTTKDEFKEILAIATDDIKFNRIGFGKCTGSDKFIEICETIRKRVQISCMQ